MSESTNHQSLVLKRHKKATPPGRIMEPRHDPWDRHRTAEKRPGVVARGSHLIGSPSWQSQTGRVWRSGRTWSSERKGPCHPRWPTLTFARYRVVEGRAQLARLFISASTKEFGWFCLSPAGDVFPWECTEVCEHPGNFSRSRSIDC